MINNTQHKILETLLKFEKTILTESNVETDKQKFFYIRLPWYVENKFLHQEIARKIKQSPSIPGLQIKHIIRLLFSRTLKPSAINTKAQAMQFKMDMTRLRAFYIQGANNIPLSVKIVKS